MTNEIWAPVVEYEGLYEASSLGRIRSVDHITGRRKFLGKVLKPTINYGYERVGLTRGGKSRTFLVHRLVLAAFAGEPEDGMQCCHNDDNKKNNALSNLRWGSCVENHEDMVKRGRSLRGAKNRNSLLTDDGIRSIFIDAIEAPTFKVLAEKYRVDTQSIHSILTRKNWRHVPIPVNGLPKCSPRAAQIWMQERAALTEGGTK